MSLGERIRFFRKRNRWTQEELGKRMGFKGTSANIRIAQYEWNRRAPKQEVIDEFAKIFDVVPEALQNPDIDSKVGLMHTLFTLEDLYGIAAEIVEGRVCLKPDIKHPKYSAELVDDLAAWSDMRSKLEDGTITREEYNHWRYHYPKDREDPDRHRGNYSLLDLQGGPSMVKEETPVYDEDDVINILRLYKETYMDKSTCAIRARLNPSNSAGYTGYTREGNDYDE